MMEDIKYSKILKTDITPLVELFIIYIEPCIAQINLFIDLNKIVMGEFVWNYSLPYHSELPTVTKLLEQIVIPTDVRKTFNALLNIEMDKLYDRIKQHVQNKYFTCVISGTSLLFLIEV